jgi:hypothetical protein
VLRSALSFSAQINCRIIRVPSLVAQFVNFDPETIVFLGYVLSKNDPSWKPSSSSDILTLDAAASSLSMSQMSQLRNSTFVQNLCFCESPLMAVEKGIFSPPKSLRSEMPRYFSCTMAVVFYRPVSLCPTDKHK